MTAPAIQLQPNANPAPPEGGITDKLVAASFPILVALFVIGSWIVAALDIGGPRLEIVSYPSQDSAAPVRGSSLVQKDSSVRPKQTVEQPKPAAAKTWNISGRVLIRKTGRPARVRVWAIAVDSAGNRFSPPDTVTDDVGRFRLGPIPARFTSDSLQQATDVTVYASGPNPSDTSKSLRGEENLRLTRFGKVRWVEVSPWILLSVGVIFFAAIVVGLVRVTVVRTRRAKYYTLVVLSFLFSITMIALIAMGLRNVNATATQGDVMSLGFANIYRGTYVKDVPPEWLFSLTTPQLWKPGEITTGFGIPIWLLLIAVLGAGVYTIALLVKHVTNQASLDNEVEYPKRISELVQHQFYLLFSPLGAMLVYQIMVAAGLASVQVTVAVAIFAAGVAANALLDKAIKAVQEVLK